MTFAEPYRRAEEQAAFPLHGPVETRDLLNQLRVTSLRERLVILLVDEDEQVSRVARLSRMPTNRVPRLCLDRKHLAYVLKCWRRLQPLHFWPLR